MHTFLDSLHSLSRRLRETSRTVCVCVFHSVQMSDKVSARTCDNCDSASASDYKPLQCESNAAPSLRC